MLYIEKLPSVPLLLITTGEPVESEPGVPGVAKQDEYLLTRLTDAVFTKTTDDVFSAMQIRNAVVRAFKDESARFIALETEDHKRLLKAVKTPSTPYPPQIAWCYADFMRAVENALTEAQMKARLEEAPALPASHSKE